MLKDRKELEKKLQNKMVVIAQDKTYSGLEHKKEVIKTISEKYNIPIDMLSDLFTFRKGLSEVSVLVVFAITDIIAENQLSTYFTQSEIDTFSVTKFDVGERVKTLSFKMLQVADDQWIGITDVKSLMYMRDCQIIHYNGDTQRALQHVIRHGNEILQPFLNLAAVTAISEQYSKNEFIPNTITLNLPEETEYEYSDKNCELTIYDIDHLDITDGYHRYVAMGTVFDNSVDFNYPVELRITRFSTVRAQQFIYQEDQKTKMRKLDSKFYNPTNYGNMIVRKLDENSNLRGKINNKDGLIDAPFLAEYVNKVWKPKSNKEVVEFSKTIRERLNLFTEEYTDYLERKWTRQEIMVVFYGIYSDIPLKYYADFIDHVSKNYPEIGTMTIVRKKFLDTLGKVVRRYV